MLIFYFRDLQGRRGKENTADSKVYEEEDKYGYYCPEVDVHNDEGIRTDSETSYNLDCE